MKSEAFKIVRALRDRGLSDEAIAAGWGVSFRTIFRIRTGETIKPRNLDKLRDFAREKGLSVPRV